MKRPTSPREAREAAAARRKRHKAHAATLAALPIGASRCDEVAEKTAAALEPAPAPSPPAPVRCTAEHGGSDPHHVRTRGAGGSDLVTTPVCRVVHDAIGAGKIDGAKVEAALGRTILQASRQPAAWWERVAREILGA